MLQFELTVSNGRLIPTKYAMTSKDQGLNHNNPKKKYYTVNRLGCNFAGGWGEFTLYYRRQHPLFLMKESHGLPIKVDFQRGGEYYSMTGMDAAYSTHLIHACHEQRYLTTANKADISLHYGGKKRKLPLFFCAQTLNEFKKLVFFELFWADDVSKQLLNNNGQKVYVELNLYDEPDE